MELRIPAIISNSFRSIAETAKAANSGQDSGKILPLKPVGSKLQPPAIPSPGYVMSGHSFTSRLAAFVLLILLSPVLLLISFLQVLIFRGIIFRQVRTGTGGRLFSLYKFQTIHPTSGAVPVWGRFLRSTSLDELPQLWNILRGEMNFVGPRPLLPEYLPLYSRYQQQRHGVKPGLTGWAQVNGRNALSWQEQFEMDVWYVQHRSSRLDIRILILTMRMLLSFKPRYTRMREAFNGKN